MIVYTYYSKPWELSSGDDIRIHTISKAIKEYIESKVIVYNISLESNEKITVKDGIVYASFPRRLYLHISKFLKWKQQYDLNPIVKITHYIDEFLLVIKLASIIRRTKLLYVFGSMTLFSFFLRILRIKDITIIYDPLANYAQTLYLRSRYNKIELIRYGLYLVLHKLQLKCSNFLVYPSKIDLQNAKKMFNVKNTVIVPNYAPICYESFEEYQMLRAKRKDFKKPYFILLAGGKGKGNEEAVKLSIEIFNEMKPETFHLYITGPWEDLKRLVKNPSIEISGVLEEYKLKGLLALCDYGLAPIFNHIAGTFLKVITYVSAGLHIVTTKWGIQEIDADRLKGRDVFIVKNINEYKKVIQKIISNPKILQATNSNSIEICKNPIDINISFESLKELILINKIAQ